MKKTLLLNPDVALIVEEFLSFYGKETGLFTESDIETQNLRFSEFVTYKIGEIKTTTKKQTLDLEQLAKDMQEIVPDIKVQPSNKNLRSNTQNLVNKLKTFTKSWKYSYSVILEATKLYGEYVNMHLDRMHMPLNYFILKDGDSRLAEYCDRVLKEEVYYEKPKSNSKII